MKTNYVPLLSDQRFYKPQVEGVDYGCWLRLKVPLLKRSTDKKHKMHKETWKSVIDMELSRREAEAVVNLI